MALVQRLQPDGSQAYARGARRDDERYARAQQQQPLRHDGMVHHPALGEPERIIGYNTCQVAKYGNYELGSFSEEAKHAWRDAHWEEDLQKAFETGKRMAEQKTLSH